MNTKVAIISVVGLIAVAGLLVGIYLVQQTQLLDKDASVGNGTATVSITPSSQSTSVGQSFDSQINFTTGGRAISSIQVELAYTYTTSEPTFDVTVEPNPTLATSGQWNFPTHRYSASNGTGRIVINAVNTSGGGYNPGSASTTLATLRFTGRTPGSVVVSFDTINSIIVSDAEGADILLTPDGSTGAYTVTGATPTSSPTPTTPPGATNAPTPTNRPGATNTPAPTSGSTTHGTMSITYPPNNSTITDTTPTIRGIGPASSKITLAFTSGLTGTTNADSVGNWSWTPSSALSGGSHTVTATNDKDAHTATVTFTITTGTGSSTLPQAGNIHLTVLVAVIGVALLAVGAFLL